MPMTTDEWLDQEIARIAAMNDVSYERAALVMTALRPDILESMYARDVASGFVRSDG